MDLRLYTLSEEDFDNIIPLATEVAGENYINREELLDIFENSFKGDKSCSIVLYDGPRNKGNLVGFRLTYAPGNWSLDEWFSPEDWKVDPEYVCLFKCNMLDKDYRGMGIGPYLLEVSIESVKKMGAKAGVAHVWMQSPNNAAYKYFTSAGAEEIRIWPERWKDDYANFGYICSLCGKDCTCDGAEMIIYFEDEDE